MRGDGNGRGVNTRPESLELQLPLTASVDPNSEVSSSHFSLLVFLPCPLAPNTHPHPLCDRYLFPNLRWKHLWAGLGVGIRQEETGEEEVSWVLGKTGSVGGDSHYPFSGHTDRDRQDGFPPATSPWAASGLEGGTGERGIEMLETFTLLSRASPSFLPLSLSSDPDSFPRITQPVSPIFSGFQSPNPHTHPQTSHLGPFLLLLQILSSSFPQILEPLFLILSSSGPGPPGKGLGLPLMPFVSLPLFS